MRVSKIIVAIVASAAVAGSPLGPVGATQPTNPFTGTWTGVDDLGPDPDLSNVTLIVGEGPAPTVRLEDDGATICGGAVLEGGTFEGRGRYDRLNDVLVVNFTRNECVNGTRVGPLRGIEYVFDGDHIVGGGATYLP